MKLIVITGRSGSGKSISLRLFEDMGYFCVDNLPISLLPALEAQIHTHIEHVAVSIDARNISIDHDRYQEILKLVKSPTRDWEILFFDADDATLLKRFSETRRKHPLTNKGTTLREAIVAEKKLLEPLANVADLMIDTSKMSTRDLRQLLKERISVEQHDKMSILLQSFGFKHGIPADADYVFDVRCLPNPYWIPNLAPLTGRDAPVQSYLSEQERVQQMEHDISQFLSKWIEQMQADNRRYLTIAIGCTGGQHRSVYMVEQLAKKYFSSNELIQIRHRELTL